MSARFSGAWPWRWVFDVEFYVHSVEMLAVRPTCSSSMEQPIDWMLDWVSSQLHAISIALLGQLGESSSNLIAFCSITYPWISMGIIFNYIYGPRVVDFLSHQIIESSTLAIFCKIELQSNVLLWIWSWGCLTWLRRGLRVPHATNVELSFRHANKGLLARICPNNVPSLIKASF